MVPREKLHEQMRSRVHRDRRAHQALRLHLLLRSESMQRRQWHLQRPNNQGNRPPTGPRAPSCLDRYHIPVLTVSIKLSGRNAPSRHPRSFDGTPTFACLLRRSEDIRHNLTLRQRYEMCKNLNCGKNDFAGRSKNFAGYGFENNFVGPLK